MQGEKRMTRYIKNFRPFTAVCDCQFGRKVIKTKYNKVTDANIVEVVNNAMATHIINREEIAYLDRYYRGDQPILYRSKVVRPEVNNKIVINIAKMIVDIKTSELVGEPIQYVLRGTDEKKAEEITKLNDALDNLDKQDCDIEICEWKSICGVGYRYIGAGEGETPFDIRSLDPRETFVIYDKQEKPLVGCNISENENGKEQIYAYTKEKWYVIEGGKIVNSGINGNNAIPIVEYPNNSRRLSDIEITIPITDEINRMASDRSNGIEQFVSAWVKFVNCEIDRDLFVKMRQEGVLTVKSNNGSENKADVDVMTSELNQTEAQVAMDDLCEKVLIVQGLANRQGNTGGDTQGAVSLRNGFYTQEKRSEILEPILKKAEKQTLRLILKRLKTETKNEFTLTSNDVEVKITRTKADNMLTKAQVLQMLLTAGIDYTRAIKTVGLFSDPEQVALESADRMEILYPTEVTENAESNRV